MAVVVAFIVLASAGALALMMLMIDVGPALSAQRHEVSGPFIPRSTDVAAPALPGDGNTYSDGAVTGSNGIINFSKGCLDDGRGLLGAGRNPFIASHRERLEMRRAARLTSLVACAVAA